MIVSLTLTLASWFSMRISFELLSDCHFEFESSERKRNVKTSAKCITNCASQTLSEGAQGHVRCY